MRIVLAWLVLTCVMIFGGTPQSFWLVSRNATILPSLAAKVLNSGHTSSRDALRSLAALITAAPFSTSSRIAGKVHADPAGLRKAQGRTGARSAAKSAARGAAEKPPLAGAAEKPPGAEPGPAGGGGNADPARRGLPWRRWKCRILPGGPGLAAAETRPAAGRSELWPGGGGNWPQPRTARQQPERMRRPKSGTGASDMASSVSSPSPTPLGTAIHTKPRIRAIGRHQGAPLAEFPNTGTVRTPEQHWLPLAPSPAGVKPVKSALRTVPCPNTTFEVPGFTSPAR